MSSKAHNILKWAKLAPEALRLREAKTEKINRWLKLIQTRTLYWDPETNVFVDERFKNAKRCGMTKILKKQFYPNFLPVENKQNRRSGKEVGERFHRYIYHRLICLPLQRQHRKEATKQHQILTKKIVEERAAAGKPPLKRLPKLKFDDPCQCKEKFHKATVLRKQKTSSVHLWVEQAQCILDDLNIKLIGCELIASCEKGTTSVDALGWCGEETNLVNISWKTGYSQRTMHKPRTEPEHKGQMVGYAKHLPNSEHLHHQLQQLVENQILKKGHDIEVNRNLIIYFGANNKDQPVVCDSTKEEFLNPKRKENQELLDFLL